MLPLIILNIAGDYSILDEILLDQDCLAEDEDERYTIPAQLDKKFQFMSIVSWP